MNGIAKYLTDYILSQKVITEDKYEIYKYGFLIGIEILINIIASLTIAIFMDSVIEFIFFICIFFYFRSYAGGLHLDHFVTCFICSCIVMGGVLYSIDFIVMPVPVYGALLAMSSIYIFLNAPIDNVNKKLDSIERSMYSKKVQFGLLIVLIAAIVLFMTEHYKYSNIISNTLFTIAVSMFLGKIKNKRNHLNTLK